MFGCSPGRSQDSGAVPNRFGNLLQPPFYPLPGPPLRTPPFCFVACHFIQAPASMAFVTDSNRPQPLRQPPPTACLPASGAASETPPLLMHPRPPVAVPRRVRWLGMAAAHALFLAPHPPLGVLPPRWHNESRGALWVQHGIPLSGYYLLRLPGGPLTHADPVRLVRGLPSHTMPPLVAPACPPGAPGCRRVAGHDVYVGDGDRPGPSVAECERRLFIGDPRLATYWPIHAFMPQCCGPIVLPLPLGAVFLDA